MVRYISQFVAISVSIAALLVSPPLVERASARPGINVGVLVCQSVPGTQLNLIIHSSVNVTCVFNTPFGQENYKGTTGIGLGADLGWSKTSQIVFKVLMVSSDVNKGSHSLAGRYFGGKASVRLGAGVGAAVLIGAGAKSVSLQPIGLEMSTGLGVSAGLAYLTLVPSSGL